MRVCEPYTIFKRTLKSGKQIWYYQFRDEYGRRSSLRSTGCTTRSAAIRFCQNLYNKGLFGIDSTIKFSDYAQSFFDDNSTFLKWKEVNNKKVKETTLESYNKLYRNQILPYFGDMPLNKINTATVKEWIVWMSDKWSPKTTNNAQTVLNIMLKSAFERGLIRTVPSKDLSFRKVDKKDRNLLTKEEIRAIYYSPLWTNETRRTVFLLDAITGMRIGEIAALTEECLKGNYIDVKHSYNDRYGLGTTKTKISRYVPIPEGFFNNYKKGDTWIFQRDYENKPVHQHGVYKNLMDICESMGIDHKKRGITLHTVRNFFISYLGSENIPEPKIRAIVGHSDETMTDVYTYWKPEMFPEIYEAQVKLYKYITEEE